MAFLSGHVKALYTTQRVRSRASQRKVAAMAALSDSPPKAVPGAKTRTQEIFELLEQRKASDQQGLPVPPGNKEQEAAANLTCLPQPQCTAPQH